MRLNEEGEVYVIEATRIVAGQRPPEFRMAAKKAGYSLHLP